MNLNRKKPSRIGQLWAIVTYAFSVFPDSRWRIPICTLLGFLELAILIFVPIVTGQLIDGLARRSPGDFRVALEQLVLLTLSQVAVSLLFQIVSIRVDESVGFGMRQHLVSHVLSKELRFYEKVWVGDILSRVLNDSNALRSVLTDALLRIVFDVVTVVVVFSVLLTQNLTLALLTVAAVPLSIWIGRKAGPIIERRTLTVRQSVALLTGHLQSWLSDPAALKAHVLEAEASRQFKLESERLMNAGVTSGTVRAVVTVLSNVLYGIPSIAIFGYGGYEVMRGELSVGSLFAFSTFVSYFSAPMQRLTQIYLVGIPAQVPVFERLKQLENENSTVPTMVETGPLLAVEALTVTDAILRLSPRFCIHIPDFSIRPGELVGIAGPNGSGKSTVSRLLSGIYKPDSGEIALDCADIGPDREGDVRPFFGLLPQTVSIFPGSLLENATLFDKSVDTDRLKSIEQRLKLCTVTDALQQGWQTQLNPGLIARLSPGQLKRIGLCRLLYRNAPIWILDEPTASVDVETFDLIESLLGDRDRSRAVIVLSHDSAILALCDRRYQVENDPADPTHWWCRPQREFCGLASQASDRVHFQTSGA